MNQIVYDVIKEYLIDDESKIKPDAKLIDDLGADSLNAVEIIMELEKRLDIIVDDKEIDKIVTVQDIINIVEAKK
tara:strand:- start:212 stop:436 length:225 start_codon:yes stop_codon:yes gene_type:complete